MVMKQGVNGSCRIRPHYIYMASTLAQLSLQIGSEPAMHFFLVAQLSLHIGSEPPSQFHRVTYEEPYGSRCASVVPPSTRTQNNMLFET